MGSGSQSHDSQPAEALPALTLLRSTESRFSCVTIELVRGSASFPMICGAQKRRRRITRPRATTEHLSSDTTTSFDAIKYINNVAWLYSPGEGARARRGHLQEWQAWRLPARPGPLACSSH